MNPLKAANPVTVVKGAVGLAGAAVGVAGAMARETIHLAGAAAGFGSADVGDAPTPSRPTTSAAAHAAASDVPGAPKGPTVVPVEPHAPEEPPVDVVGQALAAERATELGEGSGGMVHEPRGASRDEEHGDAALQRAEVEELAQEAAAALEGDVEPTGRPTE